YRSRLAATSVLEAQYMDLQRDYQSAAEKYERLQHQQDLTAQNAELVSRKATEFLDVLDPPTNPQKPSKPQRGFIVGAGLAVSFIVGLALAGVQEAKDTSLKNLKDVRAYTNLPVLSSIPLLENTLLVKRKRRIMYLAWSAAVIIGLLAIAAALFYYSTVIANT
ncbi:MAG TPA: GNVR domain-containing protein, partial [Bryobacteraceae bacterium]|nr:GNVR domain-containing protein [Bryobacteraceae bacterium]